MAVSLDKDELSLMWFKNEEKYINENTISALLQNMLNTAAEKQAFKVYLDSKAKIEESNAYVCILKTRIEPYMLKGAHCENVSVRLSIKYPIENEAEKMFVINTITKCLGFVTGGFTVTENDGDKSENVEYTFCSNFTKDESGTPENINSIYTGTLIMKGDMHITRSDGGILGDMVKMTISVNGTEYEVVARTVETSVQSNIESPIKAGSFVPDTEYTSATYAKTLIILYRNDTICNMLRRYYKGVYSDSENPFLRKSDGKPILCLGEYYPAEDSNHTIGYDEDYYIYEVKETRESGNYIALSVTLIKTPDE